MSYDLTFQTETPEEFATLLHTFMVVGVACSRDNFKQIEDVCEEFWGNDESTETVMFWLDALMSQVGNSIKAFADDYPDLMGDMIH